MPGFVLNGLHVLSRCFSRSNPCITGFTSIRRCQWKMQSPRLHSRPPGSASCDRGQGLGIVTSTFSNPDACEVQESLHYFMLHVGLNCNLLSFHSSDLCLNSYGKKRKKNPMDCETWISLCLFRLLVVTNVSPKWNCFWGTKSLPLW